MAGFSDAFKGDSTVGRSIMTERSEPHLVRLASLALGFYTWLVSFLLFWFCGLLLKDYGLVPGG